MHVAGTGMMLLQSLSIDDRPQMPYVGEWGFLAALRAYHATCKWPLSAREGRARCGALSSALPSRGLANPIHATQMIPVAYHPTSSEEVQR